MAKFTVIYEVYASTYVEVDCPKGATREQIIEAADREVSASVCHQCASEVEIGDIGDVTAILDENGAEMPKDKPKRKAAPR